MTRLFITATGTDIGKTFVTAMLASHAHRAGKTIRVLKPLTSGFNEADPTGSDPAILLEAIGKKPTPEAIQDIAPWRYAAPIAPHMAAAKEGREVPFGEIVDFCHEALSGPEDIVIIEGAGGVMSPLDASHTTIDWISALGLPTLLIGGTYLGTISHSLSALAALRAASIRVPAIVLSETENGIVPPDEQAKAISAFTGGVPVHTIPRQTADKGWTADPCPLLCSLLLGRPSKAA